jgi:hypothetical protein
VGLEELPRHERIARYMELAAEAAANADRMKDEDSRRSFLMISAQWIALADALKANARER